MSPRLLSLVLAAAPAWQDAPPEPQEAPPADFAAPPREPAGVALARLADELERALAARDRATAETFGLGGSPGEDAADPAWWRRFLESQESALGNLWGAALTARERSLRDALVARCQGESILAVALPRSRWDPLLHVELAQRELERALQEEEPRRAERLQRITSMLEGARLELVSPRVGWIEEAQIGARGLREALRAVAGEPGGPAALAACERFEHWLGTPGIGRGDAIPHLGLRNWEALAQASSGTGLSTVRMRVELLRTLARIDTEIAAAQPPEPPDAPIEEVLERAAREAESVRALVVGAQLAPLASRPLSLVARQGSLAPGAAARVQHLRERTVVTFLTPHPLWAPTVARCRAAQLSPSAIAAQALRFGAPGEEILVELGQADPGARPLTWSRSVREGWGMYALDWLLRHPSTAPTLRGRQPELCLQILRARRYETALFLAALEWHALDRGEDLVVEDLARRADLPLECAAIDVRRVTHDPLLGVGALGALELERLERELLARLSRSDGVRVVLTLLASQPSVRPADVLRNEVSLLRPG